MKKIFFLMLILLNIIFISCSQTSSVQENIEFEKINEDKQPLSDVVNQTQKLNYRVIDIQGFNYSYSQSEIKLKKGEPVRLIFRSTQGFHDFVVDELGVATTKINEGKVTGVTFTPEIVGEFEFYCSVGNHRQQGMVGTISIEE